MLIWKEYLHLVLDQIITISASVIELLQFVITENLRKWDVDPTRNRKKNELQMLHKHNGW